MNRLVLVVVATIAGALIFGAAEYQAQESTPVGTQPLARLAESDAMWAGNFVFGLPNCASTEICMASLTQSARGDEYYYGVIQNNTDKWVNVDEVTTTLFDGSGDTAAIGDSVTIAPSVISPGGHALVMITVVGEFIAEFSYEAEFIYEPSTGEPSGFGVPVQINEASIRGNGILGDVTNTSSFDFGVVNIYGACMNNDGDIEYWFSGEATIRPFPVGETARFSAEIYGNPNCSNFVLVAWGNPYA